MPAPKVVLVHLHRPNKSDPNEQRADPFWEFGSFGCTRCHTRNLVNPKRIHELDEQGLAWLRARGSSGIQAGDADTAGYDGFPSRSV